MSGSDVYTHGHHEAVLRSHRWRTAENSAAYLLPHLRPGVDLLDVGCGPGTLTVDLAALVHAHQVLQHQREPVGALRAMAALARPGGGLVAARDADYAAMTWAPADARLDRWLAVYRAVAAGNGAEPDAGRHLLGWARAAGLDDVAYSTSTWTFATPDDRSWWSGTWAERITATRLADQALDRGLATRGELEDMAAGWRAWAERDDAVFTVVHGEVVARA